MLLDTRVSIGNLLFQITMTDLLLVEVQGENGAYYKAFVTNLWEEEIQLAFEHDWQPESRSGLS